MADDLRPPELVSLGLAGLIEGLRDDVREDIRDLKADMGRQEERMTARMVALEGHQQATHDLLTEYAAGHGKEHEAEAEERRITHSAFYDFIRRNELEQARRDGALGVMRYSVELVSRHGTNIAKVLLAAAGLLAVATGSLHVAVT